MGDPAVTSMVPALRFVDGFEIVEFVMGGLALGRAS
jgi:hypothetical protein